MGSGFDLSATISGMEDILSQINGVHGKINAVVKEMYGEAADQTYQASQADVPVLSGQLKGSGTIAIDDQGNVFCVEVVYGDGQETATTYSYSAGDSTSVFADDAIEARGYSDFTELGHLSRGGNMVPPQAYLGPNFDIAAIELLDKLNSMFSM